MFCAMFETKLGRILLQADRKSLTGAWFEGQKNCPQGEGLSLKTENSIIRLAKKELTAYLNGEINKFKVPLNFTGTNFQENVWQKLLEIPYGETLSYGEIAKLISSRSARAVGGAVGRNPLTIFVPCHRVVGSKGALTGFASGLDRKKKLLELEMANKNKFI